MQRLAALPSGPWVNTDSHLYAASGDVVAARLDAHGQQPKVVAAARAHASASPSAVCGTTSSTRWTPTTFALGSSRGPLSR
ncbi:MAG: hypothetical protein AB1511_04410 [Deinococcota bacterium]